MMSSKFVGFFEMEVTEWQKKLGTADAVIALWFEVQRKWQYLESIFVGSDDIRSQLPEDSARFDIIDKSFKVSVFSISSRVSTSSTSIDKVEAVKLTRFWQTRFDWSLHSSSPYNATCRLRDFCLEQFRKK